MLADSGPPAVRLARSGGGPGGGAAALGARVVEVGPAQSSGVARVLDMARRGAGALLVPVTWEALVPLRPGSGGEVIVQRPGVNLVREVPGIVRWPAGLGGRWCSATMSAPLAQPTWPCAPRWTCSPYVCGGSRRSELAFPATPTDVIVVPADVVAHPGPTRPASAPRNWLAAPE